MSKNPISAKTKGVIDIYGDMIYNIFILDRREYMKNKYLRIIALCLALMMLGGCTAPNSGTSDTDAIITPETAIETPAVTDDSTASSTAEQSSADAPTTDTPTTDAPITDTPTTDTPITDAPTTDAPITEQTPPPKDPLEGMTNSYTPLNYADMKAMWLSQFDLNGVYCASGSQRDETAYRRYVDTILDNVVANGFNTVIVQVRPYADSMYPSDYYPMSKYVVGSYGRDAKYDPFAIMIEKAHERKLSVQAWINPMRAMTKTDIASVPSDYLIKQWYNDSATKGKYVVEHTNNYCYLNPAYAEVRGLIINGAREIMVKYNVDGLHMDDYFYPTADAVFDSAAYNEYKQNGGTKTLQKFRMEQLNKLVSGLYSMVKSVNPNMIFGISPAGNDNNVRRDGADIDTWCANAGYIDYICPQVYFGLEHGSFDFVKVCNTWQKLIKVDSIKLIVGMTLGKAKDKTDAYAGAGKNEWAEHSDVLKRCLEYTASLERCGGVAYFCYQYFYHPTSGAEESATKQERDNFIPLLKTITWN